MHARSKYVGHISVTQLLTCKDVYGTCMYVCMYVCMSDEFRAYRTGYCTCSKCRSWDSPNVTRWNQPGASQTGSLSDRYARFFDSVYSILNDTTQWVTAYAYMQYRDPPVDYQIKGNVPSPLKQLSVSYLFSKTIQMTVT